MPRWWNGRHPRLRISCPRGRTSSSLVLGTKKCDIGIKVVPEPSKLEIRVRVSYVAPIYGVLKKSVVRVKRDALPIDGRECNSLIPHNFLDVGVESSGRRRLAVNQN
jgi:hypothetical protein